MPAQTREFSPKDVVQVKQTDMAVYMPEQPALTPALQKQVGEIVRRSQAVGVSASYAFSGPMFSGHLRLPGPERDWFFMPLEEDPLWAHKQGYPMPDRIIRDLRRLDQAGIKFDGLYVAHETLKEKADAPHQAMRDDRATLDMVTPPPSPKAQAASARLGGWAAQALRVATWPMLGLGLGMLATGAVAATAIAAAPLLMLDPILFGCVAAERRQGIKPNALAGFVYLGHWTWSE